MEKCEKCGQEIKNKIIRRKTRDIWENINLLLGLDWDNYAEHISGIYTSRDLLKLENAIIKLTND